MKKEIKISKRFILNFIISLLISLLIVFILQVIYGKFYWHYPNYANSKYNYFAYSSFTHKSVFVGDMSTNKVIDKIPFWLLGVLKDYLIGIFIFSVSFLILEIKRKFKFKIHD